MLVSYDGSAFRGFARQPGQHTVAGELAKAVSKYTRHDVEFVCAGRTDAGVHASGQVVHADISPSVDLVGLRRSVNRQLAPAIAVRAVEPAPAGFDARRSAKSRSYRYLVHESDFPDPLLAGFSWNVSDTLDVRSMRAGADALLGEHNFAAFCRRPPGHAADEPINRRVLDARWSVVSFVGPVRSDAVPKRTNGTWDESAPASARVGHFGDVDRPDSRGPDGERLLRFDITATSFCHQMVRSVVGTLVEIGRGHMRPSDIPLLLSTGDRTGARSIAPPHGLCLMHVEYVG